MRGPYRLLTAGMTACNEEKLRVMRSLRELKDMDAVLDADLRAHPPKERIPLFLHDGHGD